MSLRGRRKFKPHQRLTATLRLGDNGSKDLEVLKFPLGTPARRVMKTSADQREMLSTTSVSRGPPLLHQGSSPRGKSRKR